MTEATQTDTTEKPAAGGAAPSPASSPPADSSAAPAAEKKPLESLREIAGRKKEERTALSKAKAEAQEARENLARIQAEKAALEARAKQLDEWENLSKADKIAAAKKLGIDPRQLAEAIIKDGTPEAQQEAVLARIQAQEEDNKRLRQELQERDARAANERAYLQARKVLQDEFAKNKDKLPLLTHIAADPAKLEYEFARAVQEIRAHPEASKHAYSDADILLGIEQAKRIDAEAALEGLDLDLLEKVLTRRKTSATTTKEASEASAGQSKSGANGRAATLTNALASDGASSWRPKNWDSLTDRQQNKILAERLDRGLPID